MASHGVPRAAGNRHQSEAARDKEIQEIKVYRALLEGINEKVENKDYSPKLLEETGALLQRNPEYYTIWNIRRRIFSNEFENIERARSKGDITPDNQLSQNLDILQLDLQFLFPLLLKFPKCYWIWNHRIWLLQQSSRLLPSSHARRIWEEELGLVGKMLRRDSRNYHGWGYRRFIVQNLESPDLGGQSLARAEYEYTTKMIKSDLSNFSAWHNRIKLIQRVLDEENAAPEERRRMFNDELALIHEALFDPYDQSLWFYHAVLMNTFDPDRCEQTLVPDLSLAEQTDYIEREIAFIEEIKEDADDCKWVFQALIECTAIKIKLRTDDASHAATNIDSWLQKLQELDPLRAGRWRDIAARLG